MKIQNSNINMFANSYDSEKTSIKRTLSRQNNRPDDASIAQQRKDIQRQFRDQLKEIKQSHLAQANKEVSQPSEVNSLWRLSEEDLQKITLLERILSELLGKEVKFIVPSDTKVNDSAYNGTINQVISRNPAPALIYKEEFTFQKRSKMEFQSSGTVTTEDGRQIQFNVKMHASREIHIRRTTTMIEGKMQDPLVISFDGKLPQLTDEKYDFDLDFDGRMDQISFLTKGSGFLAFDRNNDGKINDGSELFGPQSGSGFKDLAVYDLDNNGWIDENDSIFEGLRIWMKDETGKDHLFALGEKGIGAIFLGSVATHFDLLSSQYAKEGVVRESGIYLKEDGTAGTVHHIDLKL